MFAAPTTGRERGYLDADSLHKKKHLINNVSSRLAPSQTSETRSESVRFQTRVTETRKIVGIQLIHLES